MDRKKSLFFLCAILFLARTPDLSAIPSFSKKYGTSCITCHVAYPRLNANGRTFLYNGYQFPGGMEADIDKAKDEQVRLGSEAYERVFPDAVWPNTLPTFSAFSVVIEAEMEYLPDGDPNLTFDNIPSKAYLYAGGNFQDNISFLVELVIDKEGTELAAVHISFDNIIDNNGLHLKFGNMYPTILPLSQARRLTAGYWMSTRSMGDNNWNLDRTQRGLEFRGLFSGGRAIYSAGLVEGRGNIVNSDKDVYLHAGYKIGGLPLNGIPEEGSEKESGPLAENSIRFDGYFYDGTATLMQDQVDPFIQAGFGVDAWCGKLNVLAAFVIQEDDRPIIGSDVNGSGMHLITEATYSLYPWLLPNFRYERFREKFGSGIETDQRIVPGLIALVRANVRTSIFAEITDRGQGYEVEEVQFALFFGI